MVAKNDITGDKIQSKTPSKSYEDNYDNIFRKPKKPKEYTDEEISQWKWVNNTVDGLNTSSDKPMESPTDDWDETRIDIIGQNGGTGDHY
jgi:hypothetical protein